MVGIVVALPVGKMPVETEKIGFVVVFKIGNGGAEMGYFETFVETRLAGSGYPEIGVETVELGISWLVTGKDGNSNTVDVSVVVPLVTVIVLRLSKSMPYTVLVCASG